MTKEDVIGALNDFFLAFTQKLKLDCTELFPSIEEGFDALLGLREVCEVYSPQKSVYQGRLFVTPFGSLQVVNGRKLERLTSWGFQAVDTESEVELAVTLVSKLLPAIRLRREVQLHFRQTCLAVCENEDFLNQTIDFLNARFKTGVFYGENFQGTFCLMWKNW